jgi:predicted nucleic acid-binding protein
MRALPRVVLDTNAVLSALLFGGGVSGDKDLLALAGASGLCPVLSAEAFCRQPPVAEA